MNEICLSCKKHTKCGRAKHETIGCGYYVPMTNDEWRQTCSGEEFAEFLDRLAYSLYTNQNKMTCKDDWLVWLKEKHE